MKKIDFSKLRSSWTKYDVVQALDVIYSVETIQKYLNKEAVLNEPILKAFLGITNLNDPIPQYWIEIQKYPNEKKIFALLALIFIHEDVIHDFATKYSVGDMKGEFFLGEKPYPKHETNIRSALVVSEASEPFYRRKEIVPYDFSVVFYNPNVGKLFKEVLWNRITRCTNGKFTNDEFYEYCFEGKFEQALSLTKDQFKMWLEGESFEAHYMKRLKIISFFSIKEPVELNFEDSKEIYFLGENGDGKSLLLMALYLAFNGNYIQNQAEKKETGEAIDIMNKALISGFDEFEHEYNKYNAIYLSDLYAYGTHRGRYSDQSSESFERYGFMTLFNNDLTLLNPEQWIKDIKLAEEDKNTNTSKALELLKFVILEVLDKNVQPEIIGNNVRFIEKGYPLKLKELSEGYRSIIIFICDLVFRLSKGEEISSRVLESKGVVLIDEIDQHLHLKWQRAIISKLRKLFPNIQFFFTTHSPSIIQGASNDAIIYRVYREDGITKVSDPYYRKDLNDFMMNTLVTSSLFGLDDSRMDSDNDTSITDDSFTLYKINKILKERLDAQKLAGKKFISNVEIEKLINNILNEMDYDKDK
jgi:predicted ATPase